jgi:hypothetical protein
MSESPQNPPNPTKLHELVLKYADQYKDGNQDGLLNLNTLFDFLKRNEQRFMSLNDAYLKQINVLSQELAALREGGASTYEKSAKVTKASTTAPKPPASKPETTSAKPKPDKHKNAMDLGDLM